MSNRWTNEQHKMLCTMLAAGKHYHEIAAALGKTRNACIGRANRLGVQAQDWAGRVKRAGVSRRKFDHDEIRSLRHSGLTYAKIAEQVGCSMVNAWVVAHNQIEGEKIHLDRGLPAAPSMKGGA